MENGTTTGIFDAVLDQMRQFGVKHIADASDLEIIIPREAAGTTEWINYAKTQIKGSNYTDPAIKIFGMPVTWSNLTKEVRVRRDLKKIILPKFAGKK